MPIQALAGRGFHPLDSINEFLKRLFNPIVLGLAWRDNALLLICHKKDDPFDNGTNNLLPPGSGGILNPTL